MRQLHTSSDPSGPQPFKPLRIANVSGFYGDRMSAMSEMLAGGGVDVITGDYLAELTMLILSRQRAKDPAKGYALSFAKQLESNLAAAVSQGVKIVTNAGGVNPSELADTVRQLAARLGIEVKVAHVEGDDLTDRAEEFGWGDPISAHAYLGAWGIAECLKAGADVVITGRVTDASLVVGPSAWHFGWSQGDFDRLAGAVVAGHIVECGAQATGGNYSFFAELADLDKPFGFPIAEMYPDGSCIITKQAGTGGGVSVGTVTAQLLYEITGARYAGPDVTARFDSIQLEQVGVDRVQVSGAKGEPPPPDLKVGVSHLGGFRNEVTFVLTGLDIELKAALVQEQFTRANADLHLEWSLVRTDHRDADVQEEAAALLRCVVRGDDQQAIGRAFSGSAFELALASYPGFHLTSPPTEATSYGVFSPEYVPASRLSHLAVLSDGTRIEVPPAACTRPLEPCNSPARATTPGTPGPTIRVPLGLLAGARSGDKGGSANVGVWVRTAAEYAWLHETLDVHEFKRLLPETAHLEVTRHVFENLLALNFEIGGILGSGVAFNARHDPQAKAIGEWLRSRIVDVPTRLLPTTSVAG